MNQSKAGAYVKLMFACKKDLNLERMPTPEEINQWKTDKTKKGEKNV